MPILTALYRLWLRLYPRPFRDEFGAEMDANFQDSWRKRPLMAGFSLHPRPPWISRPAGTNAGERSCVSLTLVAVLYLLLTRWPRSGLVAMLPPLVGSFRRPPSILPSPPIWDIIA